MNNRIWNCKNPAQGDRIKTLCVCSAGLLRSPTAAFVLMRDFNRNCRAVGLESTFALIPLEPVHLDWADEVVVMNAEQAEEIKRRHFNGRVINLRIPDEYEAFDKKLMEIIHNSFKREVVFLSIYME